ncbi:MAG: hypothetical protein ACKO91_18610 [Acidimicrobiales bacterium]
MIDNTSGLAEFPTSAGIVGHDRLKVIRLTDPVLDESGHDVRSGCVEALWLPILGRWPSLDPAGDGLVARQPWWQ